MASKRQKSRFHSRFFVTGDDNMPAKKGDTVKVEYTGTLEDGTVFDSSENHEEPLSFELGAGQVVPGFDNAIHGMEPGEEKEVTLKPEEAYGEPNPDLVKDVPRTAVPEGMEVDVGMTLVMALQNDVQIPATIVKLSDEFITLDLNPPLAGKTLIFKIKLVEIAE